MLNRVSKSIGLLMLLGSLQGIAGEMIVPPPESSEIATPKLSLIRRTGNLIRCSRMLISSTRRTLAHRFPSVQWITGAEWQSNATYESTPDGRRAVASEVDYDYFFNTSPDNQHANIVVLDARNGWRISERAFKRDQNFNHPHRSIGISPDGKWVYVGFLGNGAIEIWDADTFTKKKTIQIPYNTPIRFLQPSPCGKYLMIALGDEKTDWWRTAILNIEQGKVVSIFEAPFGLATEFYYHPHQDLLVHVWDNGHLEVAGLDGVSRFSKDLIPHSLASVSPAMGVVNILKPTNDQTLAREIERISFPEGKPLKKLSFKTLPTVYYPPKFSPDGQYIAYKPDWRTNLHNEAVVKDLSTGREEMVHFSEFVARVSFSPTGEFLLVSLGSQGATYPKTLKVADIFGKPALKGPPAPVLNGPSAAALPFINRRVVIDLSKMPSVLNAVLEPYRNLKKVWPAFVGSRVNVEFLYSEQASVVSQTVASLSQLQSSDPGLATTVEATLKAEKKLPAARRDIHEDLALFLRGEAAIFSVVIDGNNWDATPVLTDPERAAQWKSGAALLGLELNLADLNKHFLEVKSKIKGPVILRIVHTHAGSGAPLNPEDIQGIELIVREFQKAYPEFQISGQIIAVPAKDNGDVVFASDVIRF